MGEEIFSASYTFNFPEFKQKQLGAFDNGSARLTTQFAFQEIGYRFFRSEYLAWRGLKRGLFLSRRDNYLKYGH